MTHLVKTVRVSENPVTGNGNGTPLALPISANGWPPRPFQIVSLWEMLKKYGFTFYWVGDLLGGSKTFIERADDAFLDQLVGDAGESTLGNLRTVRGFCAEVGLDMAVKSIDRTLEIPAETLTFRKMGARYADVIERVRDQLESAFFLHLPKEKADLYNSPPLLSKKATRKFPKATEDIQESAMCLALGRYTACVFHLMRVMEIGVQRFGKKLGVSIPVNEKEWGLILGAINGEIKRLPYSTTKEKEVRNRYSAASVYLENVKDAWRNPTMHPKETYTEDEAKAVYGFVRRYMEHLSAIV